MSDEVEREPAEKTRRYKNEKPISLHPLTPEEALRRAMSTPPPRKKDASAEPAGTKDKQPAEG